MACQQIRDGVHSVGAADWDRRLFDLLLPTPDGTSYNAFLVKGSERTALIDTVEPSKAGELLANLASLGVERIDYIIANHAEQDHSGSVPAVLGRFPGALVVCNKACMGFLRDLFLLPEERFRTVEDGESLSLGGKTLRFIFAPWVHWPETMLTYLVEDRILFSCDLFGSHLATNCLYSDGEENVYQDAKRYYAEIMAPFRRFVAKHLATVERLDIDIIAPSHGPLHSHPLPILDAYRKWSSDEVENTVLICYATMHGTTREMARHLAARLTERAIKVVMVDLERTDPGKLTMALLDAATIVIGSPTVLAGPHPHVVYACALIDALKPKARQAAVIGSFSWGGQMAEKVKRSLGQLQAEFLETVLVKSHAPSQMYPPLDRLADEIARRHHEQGLFG
ncbi:FprA family A-type flavoprotein [Candidatus Woesearchaeota archaeon]|nr:FprA family A-type flavoprotein [Candidatus Woesearchaeota archaeon]